MEYHLKTGDTASQRTACLVLGVFTKRRLTTPAASIDKASKGHLSALLKKGDMDGESGQSLMLYHVPGIQAERVLLIGLGAEKDYTLKTYLSAWAGAVKIINESSVIEATNAICAVPVSEMDLAQQLRESVITTEQQLYRFDQCKSKVTPPKRPLKKLNLNIGDHKKTQSVVRAITEGEAIGNASNWPGIWPTCLAISAHPPTLRIRQNCSADNHEN